MSWVVYFLPKAQKDFDDLDNSQQIQVSKAIRKVSQNPLPQSQGGYGKPLGNKSSSRLTGFLKIKLRDLGIRVVYKLVSDKETDKMIIVIISLRDDDKVYKLVAERLR